MIPKVMTVATVVAGLLPIMWIPRKARDRRHHDWGRPAGHLSGTKTPRFILIRERADIYLVHEDHL